MPERAGPITVLVADDDADDRFMIEKAWNQSLVANDLRFVEDGEELLAYLCHQGRYTDPVCAPEPGLILLDLNMPRKDGREALAEIKAHPTLRKIPVVVLTTSQADEDILRSYESGASSFITKPVSFEKLVAVLGRLGNYWIEIVELPVTKRERHAFAASESARR